MLRPSTILLPELSGPRPVNLNGKAGRTTTVMKSCLWENWSSWNASSRPVHLPTLSRCDSNSSTQFMSFDSREIMLKCDPTSQGTMCHSRLSSASYLGLRSDLRLYPSTLLFQTTFRSRLRLFVGFNRNGRCGHCLSQCSPG